LSPEKIAEQVIEAWAAEKRMSKLVADRANEKARKSHQANRPSLNPQAPGPAEPATRIKILPSRGHPRGRAPCLARVPSPFPPNPVPRRSTRYFPGL